MWITLYKNVVEIPRFCVKWELNTDLSTLSTENPVEKWG